jgi:hypothetical protein
MRKNPPIPLVIIVSAFVVIPVVFWIFTFGEESEDVRGSRTGDSGILINIISKNGAWDMSKYLCEDITICFESLTSGKSLEKTSGGGIEDQSIIVRPSKDWDSYNYVKIFVKSGWGSSERFFTVSSQGDVSQDVVKKFEHGGNTYEAVVVPIDMMKSELVDSVIFSD